MKVFLVINLIIDGNAISRWPAVN